MAMRRQVLLIGDGAIGVAIASLLTPLGFESRFIGRQGPVEVHADLSGTATTTIHTTSLSSDLSEVGLAVVAVKAFDLGAALRCTRDLPAGTPIWPVGNGAIYKILANAAVVRPDLIWRLGYCTFGISVTAQRKYAWRSQSGEVGIGLWDADGTEQGAPLPIEKEIFEAAPRHFKWHRNMEALHHRKWLFNTVINSLAAARRLPRNGDILADMPMLTAVFNEAWDLGASLWGQWPWQRHEVYLELIKLIESTHENENSMARDVRLGRRTETDYLAGFAHNSERFPLLLALHKQVSS